MKVLVDRDSVAMGDDTQSHRREFEFDAASTLGDLLGVIRPDASISGGRATWLVVLGPPAGATGAAAAPFGVYAQEWAAARLFGPSDGQLTEFAGGGDVLTLYFRYLAQVDPEIVFDRYRAGGTLSSVERGQLSGQRIAQLAEADAKGEERTSQARYLSPAAVATLEVFGCRVRVHSARYFGGELQTQGDLLRVIVQARDTMAGVSVNGRHLAHFRPLLHAEQFVIVQLGDAWRADTGRPAVLLPAPAPGLGVSAITMGRSWFVQYNQGVVRHNATFGQQEQLARQFAGYAPLDLSVIIAAYLA